MDTMNTLKLPLNQTTKTLLNESAQHSHRTTTKEAQLRLRDHIQLIDYICTSGMRSFRNGKYSYANEDSLNMSLSYDPIGSIEIDIDSHTMTLLQLSAFGANRSCEEEASLRLTDSLKLFEWVGDSEKQQYRKAPLVATEHLPLITSIHNYDNTFLTTV